VAEQHTDVLAKTNITKISTASFDAVRVTLEEAAGAEAMGLEKGMIVLSTAVAGGPFIGLLGTVWGVMSTFASIAENNSASLTTMAPGVAAALVATVTGLLVAIPAMFAYNFMVTTIRAITQELDGYATRYATQIDTSMWTTGRWPRRSSRRMKHWPDASLKPESITMKKCSKSAHETLTELNITPLWIWRLCCCHLHHHHDPAGEGRGVEAAQGHEA